MAFNIKIWKAYKTPVFGGSSRLAPVSWTMQNGNLVIRQKTRLLAMVVEQAKKLDRLFKGRKIKYVMFIY